jgi:hypothetical protein
MLKARFPVLKSIGYTVDSTPQSFQRCNDLIMVCTILHNWLIGDKLSNVWIEEAKRYEKALKIYFKAQHSKDINELSESQKRKPGVIKRNQLLQFTRVAR